VTGASSGIGAAIARELATLGVDLVLTARRRDALDAVAATCKGVKVEIVIADLGEHRIDGRVSVGAEHGSVRCVEGVRPELQRGPP